MFFHKQELQFKASPEKPDAAYALLEKAPANDVQSAVDSDPVMAAVIGQTDVQHAIVAGAGARPVDSNGNPWQGSYITSSGNLLADFMSNANAEMQGRLQVARLCHMTDDHGVRELLSFLLARDTMHQNQWLAAVAELQAEGAEGLPVPSNFPQGKEATEYSYQYLNFSDGPAAAEGSWASGPSPDGNGSFSYHEGPTSRAPMPPPVTADPRLYGTTATPNLVEKATTAVKERTNH